MGDLNAHINKNDLDFITDELNDNLDDLQMWFINIVILKFHRSPIVMVSK